MADVVARAGGATRRADVSALNLAAPLVDGIQVLVQRRVVPGTSPVDPGAGAGEAGGRRLSLATATAEDLDELPGVGPVTTEWR